MAEGGKTALVGLGREGIAALCGGLGLKPFQEREVYRWIYARRNLDPLSWSNLPARSRKVLAERSFPGLPEVAGEQRSKDGTRKFLLRLGDGLAIEAVALPDRERRTVCVSSQVGCAMGCTFCMTARLGFQRNLTAGEILSQFFLLERETDIAGKPYNVVFMGMGEPLANRENLEAALAILEDPEGMGISWRRITVSTSGLADSLEALAKSPVCPRLSLSLNAADDLLRSQIMPVNRRYPLARLREALQRLSTRERERISLEYVLLGGVNDGEEHARKVARFAKGLKVKVNLIPYNGGPQAPYRRASEEAVRAFQAVLLESGIATSIRKSRGEDIRAACGQLAREGWASEVTP